MLRYLCLFLTLTMVSGCSVITSKKLSINQPSAVTTAAYYFLPKARIHIQVLEGKGKDGKEKRALQYVETIIIPDESELLLLNYNQSALSNDSLTIQLTAEGLLKKVETTVEDKSGEVIVKLAEVGKEVAKAAMYVSSVGESPSVIRDFIISPSDFSKINTEILNIMPEKFQVDLRPIVPLSSSDKGGKDKISLGVCFRPLIPYRLTFREGNTVIEERVLLLPDGAPKICMPIERSAFVKKVTNLTFEKGILTEIHIEKPSEALGFMDIPVSIAKAIASVPAELIQLKINYSNKEKDLADARKAELKAKEALLESLKKLKDNSNTPLD
jgi:hypothetical protein